MSFWTGVGNFFGSLFSGIGTMANTIIPGSGFLFDAVGDTLTSSSATATSKELASYNNQLSKELASYNSELNYNTSKQLMEDQNVINRQNTVDAASLNKSGLMQAGLSPTMMNGGFSQNVSSASATSAGSGSPSVSLPSMAFDMFTKMAQLRNERDLVRAQTGVMKTTENLNEANADKAQAEAESARASTKETEMRTELLPSYYYQTVDVAYKRLGYEQELTKAQVNNLNASSKATTSKLPYELQELSAMAFKLAQDGKLTQETAKKIPYEILQMESLIKRNDALNDLTSKQISELESVIVLNSENARSVKFQTDVASYFGVDATAIGRLVDAIQERQFDGLRAIGSVVGSVVP